MNRNVMAVQVDYQTQRAFQEIVSPSVQIAVRCEGCKDKSAPSVLICSECLENLLKKKRLWYQAYMKRRKGMKTYG